MGSRQKPKKPSETQEKASAVSEDLTAFVRPCRRGTPGYVAAEKALDDLDQRIDKLAKHDPPKPVVKAIEAATDLDCLTWASLPYDLDEADSGWAVKDWWDRGGETYLRQFLALTPDPTIDPDSPMAEPTAWQVPDLRRTLTQQRRASHPLSFLFCDEDDQACHEAPKGWRLRAASRLQLDAEKRAAERAKPDRDCEEEVSAKPARERYGAWYDCVFSESPKAKMFPLGGMRAPEDGWVVIRGRRGHYGFCDEIRVYGLKTGAFYATQSCGGLALRSDGSVDHRATDAARKPKTIVGRIPVAALREAMWMTMIADFMSKPGIEQPFGRSVPESIPIGWPDDGYGAGGLGFSHTWASNITTLAWGYHRGGNLLTGGELRWPSDLNDAAKDHAVELLQVAESELVEGCAPARLPKLSTGGAKPGVSGIDATPQSLAQAAAALQRALDELRKQAKICRK